MTLPISFPSLDLISPHSGHPLSVVSYSLYLTGYEAWLTSGSYRSLGGNEILEILCSEERMLPGVTLGQLPYQGARKAGRGGSNAARHEV